MTVELVSDGAVWRKKITITYLVDGRSSLSGPTTSTGEQATMYLASYSGSPLCAVISVREAKR